MECRFLGAAEDIGRLGMTLEAGPAKVLIDYGMAPEKPPLYPLEAPPIDRVFLTHAHLDHSGMIPWLVRHEAAIHTTPPTAEVSRLMHHDSLKIARMEGYPQPFHDHDIEATDGLYDVMDFEHPRSVGPLRARLHSAGHIPGAAQIELDDDSKKVVFTGDLYTAPQRLVDGATQAKCDVLFMESTYAGREHPPRAEVEKEFIAFIEEVAERGGITLVAAFAVGRAQELAMVLEGHGFNVWLDGMARTVAGIYGHHLPYLRDPSRYQRAIGALKMIHGHRGRSVALREADVIITTGGMMDGGPILWYLDRLRNDPKCAVALTGYQVSGTNGRRLIDDGLVDFDMREPGKQVHKVKCEVRHFDFSAHAGHSELVEYAKNTGAEEVVLFHGDQREELVDDLSDFATVRLPLRGETFTVGR